MSRVKRLVVCCDGTWSKPDNKVVTNVEKIARSVQNDPALAGGITQLVYYIAGSARAATRRIGCWAARSGSACRRT